MYPSIIFSVNQEFKFSVEKIIFYFNREDSIKFNLPYTIGSEIYSSPFTHFTTHETHPNFNPHFMLNFGNFCSKRNRFQQNSPYKQRNGIFEE